MLMLIEEWIIKPRISFTMTHNLTYEIFVFQANCGALVILVTLCILQYLGYV